MNKQFSEIVAQLGLPSELAQELKEAWDKEVDANKEAVRAELSTQSNLSEDSDYMVKAAEAILNETLTKEKESVEAERNKLIEQQKIALSKTRKAKQLFESAKQYAKNQKEVVESKAGIYSKFVNETLATELKEFRSERDAKMQELSEERVKLLKQRMRQEKLDENRSKVMNKLLVSTLKEEMAELHADRKQNKNILESRLKDVEQLQQNVLESELKEFKEDRQKVFETLNKLEDLTVKQLTEELSEFQEDKRALHEQKIQLELDAKRQIQEFKEDFVKKSSNAASKVVNETLYSELSALRQGIKEARENTFGRKIFEAFVGEYSSTIFSERSEVQKLIKQLEESNKNVNNLQKIVNEQQVSLNKTKEQLNETTQSSVRKDKINKLTQSLGGVQKRMMVSLLESVDVNKLEKEFNRYLPQVLERKVETRKVINESAKPNRQLKESTGARKRDDSVVAKPQEVEEDFSDINKIISSAGITKKHS